MSLETVKEVLSNLLKQVENIHYHEDASVLVQFAAGEFQKLRAAFAALTAVEPDKAPAAEVPAPTEPEHPAEE